MTIELHKISVTTTGSAGSASGSAIKAVPKGKIKAVYIDYNASAPATTDVTIKSEADSTGVPPDVTVLTRSDSKTDGWFYPKVQVHDNAAAAVTGAYDDPVVHGGVISVTVAQADALADCVVVYIFVEV
ncbi:MAG: hypothetical protein Q8P22_11600 [Chloroflexota bacterium]|nr:hypothetical protein [Chloroflexota bacterium]